FEVRGRGGEEWITPTAAAILAVLGRPAAAFPAMVIEATGYGAGTMDPDAYPNVVRVVLGQDTPKGSTAEPEPPERDLVVLEANLDDLTPQLVADAVDALLAAGALDAWTTP